ncbi:SLBB domain-containing protein [Desulfobacula toluolica]|uniref:Putative polysaccharide export protein n=1 Tax=Desulfobacula toluolica (strain DSM 7467 / Tol2) TaxID=651182 RepID=K0NJ33_DESTT|nr:SLBB domain-containing protein [Desulfobacula toluolica]CCK78942.1 putative polysaccharide export protein [Desulfobacula toluolica Tol2]
MSRCLKKYLLLLLFLPFFVVTTWFRPGFCEIATKDAAYRIGIEDVVTISIRAGGEEQVETQMVVGGDGNVNIPFVGKIKAVGLTLEELEGAVILPLERDFFVDPQVHLQMAEYHSLQFFISGAVKNPGKYELDFIPTVMDLVANAGGVLPERGNIAYILRGGGTNEIIVSDMEETLAKTEPIKVDLIKLLDEGDMSKNIQLESGDTIYIPLGTKLDQAATKVYVQGKVKKPGVFDYQPGLTALAACIMAGGFDKFSAPNRAKVIRKTPDGQETIKLDLEKVIAGDLADLPLKPGDRIHVPESWL